uniref:BZIP domain-containing protein n=1 Tax=Caenorhabditis tropicalis TaxID=1561998 RepID=A0A1I7USJ4_9PELO
MADREVSTESRKPDQLMGYFVPVEHAAYVTEILELAFSGIQGATVYAGLFNRKPNPEGTPAIQPDSDFLPDMDAPEMENDSKKKSRKRRRAKWTVRKRKIINRKLISTPKPSAEDSDNQTDADLDQSKNTPQIMIQRPDLPYLVPQSAIFTDLGVARNVVQIGCKDLLTPLKELLPIGSTNQTETTQISN